MVEYVVFISALFAIFKPGVVETLDLVSVDLLLSIIVIVDLLYVEFKIGLRIRRRATRYIKYICVFWGVCLLSTVLYGHNIRGILVLMIKTILLGSLCIFSQKSEKRISRLITSSFLVFGGEMCLNLFFMFILPYGSFTEPIENMSGEVVYNYFLGPKNSFTTFALTFFLFAALHDIDKKGRMTLCTYLSVAISTYSLYKANCTTGSLIFMALCMILLFRIYLLGRDKRYMILMKAFFMLMILMMIISIDLKVDLLQKLTHSRFLIWVEAVKLILKRPLFGYGMQLEHDLIYLYGTYRYSHNEVLEILLYGGVLGFFLIVNIFRKLYKEAKNITIDKRSVLTLYMLLYFCAQIFEAQFMRLFVFYVMFIFAMFIDNVDKEESRRIDFN